MTSDPEKIKPAFSDIFPPKKWKKPQKIDFFKKGFKSSETLYREEINKKTEVTDKPDIVVKQLPKRPPKKLLTPTIKVFWDSM